MNKNPYFEKVANLPIDIEWLPYSEIEKYSGISCNMIDNEFLGGGINIYYRIGGIHKGKRLKREKIALYVDEQEKEKYRGDYNSEYQGFIFCDLIPTNYGTWEVTGEIAGYFKVVYFREDIDEDTGKKFNYIVLKPFGEGSNYSVFGHDDIRNGFGCRYKKKHLLIRRSELLCLLQNTGKNIKHQLLDVGNDKISFMQVTNTKKYKPNNIEKAMLLYLNEIQEKEYTEPDIINESKGKDISYGLCLAAKIFNIRKQQKSTYLQSNLISELIDRYEEKTGKSNNKMSGLSLRSLNRYFPKIGFQKYIKSKNHLQDSQTSEPNCPTIG